MSSCVNHADTAWVLVSTMLVLLMIPALGLFEAGLLRAKNTTSVLTQVFSGAVLLSFMWQVIGFSLVFGSSRHGIIGSPATYPLLIGVGTDSCFAAWAPTVPKRAFAEFQMMFAAISPLLMTGSFAERLRWPAFVGLIIGFELVVYYPVAHWVWGGGWLQELGTLDFAGGIVIHTTAGVGGVVVAWFIGPRRLDAAPRCEAPSPSRQRVSSALPPIPGSVPSALDSLGAGTEPDVPGGGCAAEGACAPTAGPGPALDWSLREGRGTKPAGPLTSALLPRTASTPLQPLPQPPGDEISMADPGGRHSRRGSRTSLGSLVRGDSLATLPAPEESVLSVHRAAPGLAARLETVPPSSLPLTVTGGALLWLGWFGFNAGSAMGAGPLAAVAASNTQAGAVAGGVVWMVWSCVLHVRQVGRMRLSLAATVNGIIAGLAGITPAAGYISVDYALLCGAAFGVVGLMGEWLVKHWLRVDDALDVGAVHGATGAAGALAIGLFGNTAINAAGADGLLAGGGVALLGCQAAGVAAAAAWSAAATAALCRALQAVLGPLRVDAEQEQLGLDVIDHEEAAYEWLLLSDGAGADEGGAHRV